MKKIFIALFACITLTSMETNNVSSNNEPTTYYYTTEVGRTMTLFIYSGFFNGITEVGTDILNPNIIFHEIGDGFYTLQFDQPGVYTINFSKPGYRSARLVVTVVEGNNQKTTSTMSTGNYDVAIDMVRLTE